jgi:PAS domain S-box-containing protein
MEAKAKKELLNKSKDLNEIQRLYAEQVKQLYKHTPIGVAATFINSFILTLILWKVIPHAALTIWFAACVSAAFFRYLLFFKFNRSSQTPAESGSQEMWFNISMAFSGIVWGSAGVFLFPMDSIAHQVFIAFVLGGMVAGAAGTFSIILKAFLAYSLPALIPIIIRFFAIGDHLHLSMGGMSLLFGLLMFATAKHINTATLSSLQLRFENKDLVNHLITEKGCIEKLNEDYKSEITDRKAAERALQESEEQFRSITVSAQDAIIMMDNEGDITYSNAASEKIFGYSCQEMMGRKLHALIMPERYSEAFGKGFEIFRESGQGNAIGKLVELNALKKNGTEFPIELSLSAVKIKGKWNAIGIVRDISERRRAEEEKRKLEGRLQRARKMEDIGILAGGVAHDLNNVLSGIVSYPDLLLMQISQQSPLRTPILTIQDSGIKAAAIVQDLLALARRGVAAADDVVNLNDIISEYLNSPEHEKVMLYHPEVHVETNLEGNLLNILGSPVHLSKTIMNLASNAAEAMPDGGKIFMSTENRYVDRLIRGYDHVKEGDYVILTVSDTGTGISSENMERIFEPFYTKKVMGRSGTGLGMSVVWGTVKDHKGYIDVQSTEGKGTTFRLYFPVTRQESAKDLATFSIDEHMGKGESVLVVDDVKEQREIALTMLITLGYAADAVSSGEEAVDYQKEHTADLIILDMIMDPGIDGLDTYKKIIEINPGQKAIIASGFSETNRVKEAQKLGAGAYVRKPYTLEKIGMAVKTELGK